MLKGVEKAVPISLAACLPSGSLVRSELENGGPRPGSDGCFQPPRPSALLTRCKMGLVRRTSGITGHWSMVTSLSETQDVSKTGSKDDSVLLDLGWLQFLGPILGNHLDPVGLQLPGVSQASVLREGRTSCIDFQL